MDGDWCDKFDWKYEAGCGEYVFQCISSSLANGSKFLAIAKYNHARHQAEVYLLRNLLNWSKDERPVCCAVMQMQTENVAHTHAWEHLTSMKI